jgi:hypothetical protein
VRHRKSLILGSLTLAVVAGVFLACRPPLAIEHTSTGVKVHVERLGEYNSYLTEFAVFDEASQAVVLRLVPKYEFIEMWSLPLHDGANQISPDPTQKDPGFVVAVPANGLPAFLLKGHTYRVTISGYSMIDISPMPFWRTEHFTL